MFLNFFPLDRAAAELYFSTLISQGKKALTSILNLILSTFYLLLCMLVHTPFNPGTGAGHIVNEYFTYIPRESESTNIVNFMKIHREERSMDSRPKDKMNNPLIAVPGAPGSGKSTFLSHFPSSVAYSEYVASRTLTTSPAIVSLITFNSAMSDTADALGLRILYGTLVSMGVMQESQVPWTHFFEQFSVVADWSATEAVVIIRKAVGQDRPILLLVDELSKSIDDTFVMKQLATVLDFDGNCDIVVSALSPEYIRALVTLNNRPIKYVVLGSLLNNVPNE